MIKKIEIIYNAILYGALFLILISQLIPATASLFTQWEHNSTFKTFIFFVLLGSGLIFSFFRLKEKEYKKAISILLINALLAFSFFKPYILIDIVPDFIFDVFASKIFWNVIFFIMAVFCIYRMRSFYLRNNKNEAITIGILSSLLLGFGFIYLNFFSGL